MALVVGVACGGDPAPKQGSRPSPPPDPLIGVVTQVVVRGGDVASFEVRAEGRTFEILIDAARDYGFDLHHLEEHRQTGDPVRVDVERRSDGIYAVSIDDA